MAPAKAVAAVKKSTTSPSITTDRERRVTKQAYHGLSAISLQFHHKANNTIPRDSLALILRKDLQTALKENKSRIIHSAGHRLVTYNIKDNRYVVEFLAEWIKDMNVADSLQVSLEGDLGEREYAMHELLETFNKIIGHFSDMKTYNADIHDSMIDWFIKWLNTEEINYNKAFKICERFDKVEDGSVFRVCTNVIVHHGKTLLTQNGLNWLQHWVEESLGEAERHKYPGDIMDDNFRDHCSYHLHGDNDICYKHKIRHRVQKLSTLL